MLKMINFILLYFIIIFLKDTKKLVEVIGMFFILIMMMVSRVYTNVKVSDCVLSTRTLYYMTNKSQ